MKEISSFLNHLAVYTKTGLFVGYVKNAVLDLDGGRVEGLLLTRTNPNLVADGNDVVVPYRWVGDTADIMVLRYFPETRVASNEPLPEEPEAEEFIEVPA